MLRYIGRGIARSFSFMRENSAFCFARPKVAWTYAFGRECESESESDSNGESKIESESERVREKVRRSIVEVV